MTHSDLVSDTKHNLCSEQLIAVGAGTYCGKNYNLKKYCIILFKNASDWKDCKYC